LYFELLIRLTSSIFYAFPSPTSFFNDPFCTFTKGGIVTSYLIFFYEIIFFVILFRLSGKICTTLIKVAPKFF